MRTLRFFLLILPWLLLVGFLVYFQFSREHETPQTTINSTTVLQEIESIGKLELVKYNFKEITELKKISKKYLRIFQLGPDSKIALISEGHAVGCIDLTKVNLNDINLNTDTLFIKLPDPELCYYKLDLDKTKIYSLQTNPMVDESEFIQKAYATAENEIKKAAMESGILDQTNANANTILKPMLEKISGRKVVFVEHLKTEPIEIY